MKQRVAVVMAVVVLVHSRGMVEVVVVEGGGTAIDGWCGGVR